MKRFVIIGNQRSGTTAVQYLLKDHPQVNMSADEVKLIPLFSEELGTFTFGNNSDTEKENGLRVLFDAVASADAKTGACALGIKTATTNLDHIAIFKEKIHKLPNLKVIHTVRDDYVAQYGSVLRASMTQQYVSWEKPLKDVSNRKLTVEKDEFLDYLYRCLSVNTTIQSLSGSVDLYTHKYEDLDDLENLNKSLCSFLDISCVPLVRYRNEKISPPPQDYIENYFELKQIQDLYINDIERLASMVHKKKKSSKIRGRINSVAESFARK